MRLEFKLKKKGKSLWKGKTLIYLLIILTLIGLYVSPVGQTAVKFTKGAWDTLSERAHWRLNQVVVEGHKRTETKAIVGALGIRKGQEMDTISLTKSRQNLLLLPWVRDVFIERHLPGTLIVHITEKTPIALWQNNQAYQPLDEKGYPIKDDKLLPTDLILVVGADAPENTLSLLAALEQVPSIGTQVRSAVRIEKRRWNLHLQDAESGMEIMLPETNFEEALKRLVRQNEKEDLLQKNVQAIDLRLNDRIILHPKKSLKTKSKKGKK